MSIDEVKAQKGQCQSALNTWDIIALQDGKYDGMGYGYKFTEGNYLGCGFGSMLVMDGKQKDPLNFDASCPTNEEAKIPEEFTWELFTPF